MRLINFKGRQMHYYNLSCEIEALTLVASLNAVKRYKLIMSRVRSLEEWTRILGVI